ncbi:MAG: glycosyltransferase [Bacteroidales bacterium]|nr:glycosyltransferase [Bacteroidales bacterium]
MKQLRLSIVIPFYNVEQYIEECLDSVFDQDIPLEEYEVICVNDGSPDNSRAIVLDYMNRYPNLHLVEHDVNKKLGAARNTGRSAAKGKYIWNVDSDDRIVPNCLGRLLDVCENNELDVLEFGTIQFYEEGQKSMPHVKQTEGVVKGLDYLNQLSSYQVSRMCGVWRRLVRCEFLDKHQIYSPEINMGEDIPYSFRILMCAQRMMVVPDRCYLYRLNPESLTGKNWRPSPQTLYEKSFFDSHLIYDVAMEVPKQYVNVRRSFLDTARYTLSRYVNYIPLLPLEAQKEFKTLCRNAFLENGFVRRLLSKKGYAHYRLWLMGILSLPK